MARRRRGNLRKSLLGAPKWVYRARLGFVFGRRFICVEHEGRNTATRYLTPLEVLYRDRAHNEYFVVSARGDKADWYRNISKYPATSVYIGSRKRPVRQRMVDSDDAVAVMRIYERDHPKAAAALLELADVVPNVSTEPWRSAMERIPMVGFTPR